MKLIKNHALVTILLFFSLSTFGQWYKLPAPGIPYPKWAMLCNKTYIPYGNIYPASNGEIIYDIYCFNSPSSGGDYEIMESKNDLGIDASVADYNLGEGCCYSPAIVSKNDSVHGFILNDAGI